ncbi:MAG: hypothetical protein ACFB6S_08245 [Geminicoccaceae bacterium]
MNRSAACLMVALPFVVGACAFGPDVVSEEGDPENARLALELAADDGPIRTKVHGSPLGLADEVRDAEVTTNMAEAIRGLRVSFTTDERVAREAEPHLVTVLQPTGAISDERLCTAETIETEPAGQVPLTVVAGFCDRELALRRVTVSLDEPSRERGDLIRLYWRTAGALFPDQRSIDPGINLGPFRVNVGTSIGIGID